MKIHIYDKWGGGLYTSTAAKLFAAAKGDPQVPPPEEIISRLGTAKGFETKDFYITKAADA